MTKDYLRLVSTILRKCYEAAARFNQRYSALRLFNLYLDVGHDMNNRSWLPPAEHNQLISAIKEFHKDICFNEAIGDW